MKTKGKYILYSFLLWTMILVPIFLQAAGENLLSRKIQLDKNKMSVYQLLKTVSEQTGYLFVYDSNLIDNNKDIKISKGTYTVEEAIALYIGKGFQLEVVDKYCIIKGEKLQEDIFCRIPEESKDSISHLFIKGILHDKITDEFIPYASVSIENTSIGTVSNSEGKFKLALPDSLIHSNIKFSHVGYSNSIIPALHFIGNSYVVSLEPEIVPLQQIVINPIKPLEVLNKMMEKRKQNYSQQAIYLTTFYREGIEYKKKIKSLTEAVLKFYKAPYQENSHNKDQVKLLKMRKVDDFEKQDTILAKLKSGIDAVVSLDIMNSLPEFLVLSDKSLYEYTHTDITYMENKHVNVISFEQKKEIRHPLFKGKLYIDAENFALVRAQFEINPEYIRKTKSYFIQKKSKKFDITPSKIEYDVYYRCTDDTYYINYVRGDLYFKMKGKRQLFGSSQLHTWFDMVNCEIDKNEVVRFPKSEKLPTRNIFSDTNYIYDEKFWEPFNIITPEEDLRKIISDYFAVDKYARNN